MSLADKIKFTDNGLHAGSFSATLSKIKPGPKITLSIKYGIFINITHDFDRVGLTEVKNGLNRLGIFIDENISAMEKLESEND